MINVSGSKSTWARHQRAQGIGEAANVAPREATQMKIGIKLTRSESQRFRTQEVEDSIQRQCWTQLAYMAESGKTVSKDRGRA